VRTSRSKTTSTSKQKRSKRRHESELRAARWYRLRGYRILDTNCWVAGNELDLVVRRGRVLAFCEVKSKSGPEFGDPLEMVTAEKARRVRRAADAWLALHPELGGLDVRFDVVVDRNRRLEHVPGAF
jgi:putative endonuclease